MDPLVDWNRRILVLGAVGVVSLVLFVPASTTDTALVELLVGDLPVVALYSLALLGLTFLGIALVIARFRPGTTDSVKR